MAIVVLLGVLALSPRAAAARVEALVQDAAGRPVKDAVVHVFSGVEASKAPAGSPAVMAQANEDFVPRVLAVQAGSKVVFPNEDKVHHHIYSLSSPRKFELPLYKGVTPPPVTFEQAGLVKLGCNIHDWMIGHVLVLDNPHFAVTGKEGTAVLELPPGRYKLAVWTERLKGPIEDTVREVSAGEAATRVVFRPKLGRPLNRTPGIAPY